MPVSLRRHVEAKEFDGKRLVKGTPVQPAMASLAKENEGIIMHFEKQPNGKFRAKMSYEEFFGDVTRNLAECLPRNIKKYLDV